MTVRKNASLVVTGLAFLVAFAAAPQGSSDEVALAQEASFTYENGSSWTGSLVGRCTARAVDLDPPRDAPLDIQYGSARLVWVQTQVVDWHPHAPPPTQYASVPAARYERNEIPLDGNQLRVLASGGNARAVALLHGIPWEEPQVRSEPFAARFDSSLAATGPVDHEVGIPDTFWHRLSSSDPLSPVVDRVQPVPVAHYSTYHGLREIRMTPQAPLVLAGDLALYLREAAIDSKEGRIDLGPYAQPGAAGLDNPFGMTHVSYSEAFLLLEGAQVIVPASPTTVHCGSLDGAVLGELTIPRASGTVRRGEETSTFQDRTLRLKGVFNLEEQTRSRSTPLHGEVRGQAQGDFQEVSLDAQALPPIPRPFPAPSLSQTALAVGLAALGWRILHSLVPLYTRLLPGDALSHPRRRLLVQLLSGTPGADLADLSRRSGLGAGVLRHHLRILQWTSHVGRVRHGRSTRFFLRTTDPAAVRSRILLERDARYAALHRLLGDGPESQGPLERQLSEVLGISRRGARKIIAAASSHGIVLRASGEGGTVFRAAPLR